MAGMHEIDHKDLEFCEDLGAGQFAVSMQLNSYSVWHFHSWITQQMCANPHEHGRYHRTCEAHPEI